MKSKFVFGLVAAMFVLALAPSSFAQIQITVTPLGSPFEIQTNRTAQTADPTSAGAGVLVSGQLLASSPLTTTGLLIDYPGPITSSSAASPFGAIPPSDPIAIQGATGVFAGAVISTINWVSGIVTVQLPGTFTGTLPPGQFDVNNQSGSFRLVGVRLDVNGLPRL